MNEAYGDWERVPRWNVHYWLGWVWRRWTWDDVSISGKWDGDWQYATEQECARALLEQRYGITKDFKRHVPNEISPAR